MSNELEPTRGRMMEEAFDASEAPPLRPDGPQQVIIDQKPTGALRVAVQRDHGQILVNLKKLAAAAGDEYYYRWPVKNKDGTTDWVEGPSVKCTNAAARLYGNCLVQVQAFDQGNEWLFSARFVDIETGFALERPFRQRKGQNIGGKMDRDRALDIVFQIGASKAARNVVANAIADYVDYAFEEAKGAIVTRIGKELDKYRARVAGRLAELKIPADRVEFMVGKPLEKWLAPDLARVIAEIQSVNDGMADPDEMWPPKELGAPRPAVHQASDDEVPARQVDADRPAAEGKPAETAKPAETQAKASAAPADETEASVVGAIAAAQKAEDLATLEQIDDQVCTLTDRAKRDDLRARWNEVYLERKNALRNKGESAPKTAAKPAAAASEAKPQPVSQPAQDLKDWISDQKAALEKTTSVEALDALDDQVSSELAGDQALLDDWKTEVAKRFREISKRRR